MCISCDFFFFAEQSILHNQLDCKLHLQCLILICGTRCKLSLWDLLTDTGSDVLSIARFTGLPVWRCTIGGGESYAWGTFTNQAVVCSLLPRVITVTAMLHNTAAPASAPLGVRKKEEEGEPRCAICASFLLKLICTVCSLCLLWCFHFTIYFCLWCFWTTQPSAFLKIFFVLHRRKYRFVVCSFNNQMP